MPGAPSESEFHRILFARLREYVHRERTPFGSVRLGEKTEGRQANIVVESEVSGSLVIAVERDCVYPLDTDVLTQARDDADTAGVDQFATCNSRDCFLFHYTDQCEVSEIPYYYLDLRDVDFDDPSVTDRLSTIFHAVQYLTTHGELPQQSARDRIVGPLRSFHDSIWPTLRALARETYDTDPDFAETFDEWVQENDYASLPESERFSLAAKQYAYLVASQILFYEVVRERTPEPERAKREYPLESLVEGASTADNKNGIARQFEEVQAEIDFEPVFDDGTSLFAAYPHNGKTRSAMRSLLGSIEAKNLSTVDEDLLGELYEDLIPERERKSLGQFYTHPDIAEAICNWALQPQGDGVPRVLDPASGSGTFPVAAYHRMQELAPTATHQEILDNITAIDINRFPLHLTELNLASRTVLEGTSELHTVNDSFFEVFPEDRRLSRGDDTGDESRKYDAVVANPPYIRQENLYPDRDHFRSHLEKYGAENSNRYASGRNKLSTRSDAYVYFVSHALQFLRDGGRLGFIIPTKWLTTKYGESFQEFLYDQAKVHAIVGFSDRAFTALVDTVVLFAERCADEAERRETVTDFIRVKERLSPDDLSSIAGTRRSVPDGKAFGIETNEAYRVVSLPQDRLERQGGRKIGYYLYGPSPFIPLVHSEKMQRLDRYADVAFGNKTGNNEFFLLDEQDVTQWGIDERFLQPAIRSIRELESYRVADTDQYLLDFGAYVDTVESRQDGVGSTSELAEAVKNELRNDGHEPTVRYLEYGEEGGVPDGHTVSQHTPWFNLGDLLVPDVLHPVFYNERVFTVDNAGGYAPTNAIQCVDITECDEVLPYILHSTVYKVLLELWGRHEGGGVLQLLTYEVSSVPVPSPELMSESQLERIVQAGEKLVRGVDGAQDELDGVILEFLELGLSVEEVQAAHSELVEQRVEGAATENVLIEDIDEFDEYDLRSSVPDSRSDGETDASVDDF
ncbi:Eco57I restriction-modification methylase domain-containing protein [Natronosalvus halobius]|uniref:Eco57I restriction-modification methylase domain-containing protein n=1 Tax=Natronosalvus halobius TaxID=2953746 RepID=UPI0020A0A983|nr:N-6 DNA methylase [Natronosalvus halobius]USZ71981.1 SAM-dependent methyltransferase [Natronosalvus halobius]